MTGPDGTPLRLVTEQDQVLRLDAFRAQHPDITIRPVYAGGPWLARIPAEDGRRKEVVRYGLRDLLDRLEELLAEAALDACPPADRGG